MLHQLHDDDPEGDRQRARQDTLFTEDDHVAVEITWSVYQSIITAYRDKDRGAGRKALSRLIDSIKAGVPSRLEAGGFRPQLHSHL